MKIPKLSFVLGTILFVLFILLTFLVGQNLFKALDLSTTSKIQSAIPRIFDIWFSLLSLLGSLEIVSAILFILWAIYRKLKFIYVLLFYGFFHVVEIIGKFFVSHPSPPSRFFRYDIPFVFPSSAVQSGSSFPSGHLARTTFLLIVIIFFLNRSKRFSSIQKRLLYIFCFIFYILMFISRIYLGEHWLSDVIGGSLLGASAAIFSFIFLF